MRRAISITCLRESAWPAECIHPHRSAVKKELRTNKKGVIMTTTWIRTLTLTAAALAVSSAAWAQTTRGIVDIPFGFRINETQMPAGQYRIERALASTDHVLLLSDGRHHKIVSGVVNYGVETDAARLIFTCNDQKGCTLVQVWDVYGVGISFKGPKLSSAESERMAEVVMRPIKSE
jgi:hypothetical protein